MESNYDDYEVVHVIPGLRLIDCESYQRRYRQPNDAPLPEGHYIVHWPRTRTSRRFDEGASFRGPWATRAQALALVPTYRTLDLAGERVNRDPRCNALRDVDVSAPA